MSVTPPYAPQSVSERPSPTWAVRHVTLGPADSLTGYLTQDVRGGDLVTVSPRSLGALTLPSAPPVMWVTLVLTGSTAEGVLVPGGAGWWRLRGLEVQRPPVPDSQLVFDLVNLAPGSKAVALEDLLIHGTRHGNTRRGLSMNGSDQSIVRSRILEIHEEGSDSQAINGIHGAGPFLLEDCRDLEASTENIMFGGGDPSTPGLIPSDITIRRCKLWKSPTTLTGPWARKNLFELKNAQRVLVEHCEFADYPGVALVITPRNQDGGAPWCVVRDVLIRDCYIKNVGSVLSLLVTDDIHTSQPCVRHAYRNIICENVAESGFFWQGGRTTFEDLEFSGWYSLPQKVRPLWIEGTMPLGRRVKITNNVWGAGSFADIVHALMAPGMLLEREVAGNYLVNAGDIDGQGPSRNTGFNPAEFLSTDVAPPPPPPPDTGGEPPMTTTAAFLGQSTKNVAGPSTEPGAGGAPDWWIQLLRCKAMPTAVKIEAPNDAGTWILPSNGNNWLIALEGQSPAQVNLYYEPYGVASPSYQVTVTYPDGSQEVLTALPGTPAPVPPEYLYQFTEEEAAALRKLLPLAPLLKP